MRKMKVAVLENIRTFKIEERVVPPIKDDEVLVAIKAVGICGSDIHYYEKGKIGRYVVKKPLILGHEASGEVVEIGDKIKNFKVGDKVVIEPGETCGKCEFCKTGRYNLCPEVRFFATPPVDGALCEYVVVKEEYLFKIPEEMPYEIATLVEPLAVGVHASFKAQVKVGDTVLILGLGPVGLLTILATKAFGAHKVIGVDIEPLRLEVAKKMGATYVINANEQELREKIISITENIGPDITFETAGSKETYRLAFEVTKRGGKIVVVGLLAEEEVPLNCNSIVDNEYSVFGVFRYANVYPKAIKILEENMDKANQLVTHKFKLEQVAEAFEFVKTNKDKAIKAVIMI